MEGVNQAIIADMHAPHEGDPKEELLRAGQTVGFMESARYHALDTDKDDPSWLKPSGRTTARAAW